MAVSGTRCGRTSAVAMGQHATAGWVGAGATHRARAVTLVCVVTLALTALVSVCTAPPLATLPRSSLGDASQDSSVGLHAPLRLGGGQGSGGGPLGSGNEVRHCVWRVVHATLGPFRPHT